MDTPIHTLRAPLPLSPERLQQFHSERHIDPALFRDAARPIQLAESVLSDMLHEIAIRVVYAHPQLDGEECTLP